MTSFKFWIYKYKQDSSIQVWIWVNKYAYTTVHFCISTYNNNWFSAKAFQLNNTELVKQQEFIVAYCVFQSNLSQGKFQDSMENDSSATTSKYFDGF